MGRQREIKDERKGGREEEREQGRAGMEGKEKRRRRREEGILFFFVGRLAPGEGERDKEGEDI